MMKSVLKLILGLSVWYSMATKAAISKDQALSIIARVEAEFSSEFMQQKMPLKIVPIWESWSFGAFTEMVEGTAQIQVLGGVISLKEMNEDSFLFTLCHEVGHFLGGYPKDPTLPWASAEGQADYYATAKCMKRILKNDPKNPGSLKLKLPGFVKKECRKNFSSDDDYFICLRSTKVSENLGHILNHIWEESNFISLRWMATGKVQETEFRYPSVQCRVNTAYQGSLCHAHPLKNFSNTDEVEGGCNTRPRCWFKSAVQK